MKVLWISIVLFGLLAALPPVASSGGSGPQILEEKDRGKTVDLKVGEKLILKLRNPASGGYTVNPPIFAAAVLELTAQKDIPPEPQARPRAGDSGRLFYEWQAKAAGETEIVINIFRPWEKKPPAEFWRVKVRVK